MAEEIDLALRLGKLFNDSGLPQDWKLQKLHASILNALLEDESHRPQQRDDDDDEEESGEHSASSRNSAGRQSPPLLSNNATAASFERYASSTARPPMAGPSPPRRKAAQSTTTTLATQGFDSSLLPPSQTQFNGGRPFSSPLYRRQWSSSSAVIPAQAVTSSVVHFADDDDDQEISAAAAESTMRGVNWTPPQGGGGRDDDIFLSSPEQSVIAAAASSTMTMVSAKKTSPISRRSNNNNNSGAAPLLSAPLHAPPDALLTVEGVETHNLLLRNLLHQQAKKFHAERALLVRENSFLRTQALAIARKVAHPGETAVSMMLPPASPASLLPTSGALHLEASGSLAVSPSLVVASSAAFPFSADHNSSSSSSLANLNHTFSLAVSKTTENAVDAVAQSVASSEQLIKEVERHRSQTGEFRRQLGSESRRRLQEVGDLSRRLAEVQRARASERDELKKSVAALTADVERLKLREAALLRDNARQASDLETAQVAVEKQRVIAHAMEGQLARARNDIDGLIETSNKQMSLHQEQLLGLKRDAKAAAKGLETKCNELARRNLEMARRLNASEAQNSSMMQRSREQLQRRASMMPKGSALLSGDTSMSFGDGDIDTADLRSGSITNSRDKSHPSHHHAARAGGGPGMLSALSDTSSAFYDPVMATKLTTLEKSLTVKQEELDDTREKLIVLEMELQAAKQGDKTAELMLKETERQLQFERDRMQKAMMDMARTEAELRDSVARAIGSGDAFENEDIEAQQRAIDKQKAAMEKERLNRLQGSALAASSSPPAKTDGKRPRAAPSPSGAGATAAPASTSSAVSGAATAASEQKPKKKKGGDEFSPAAAINYITNVLHKTSAAQTDPVRFAGESKKAAAGDGGGDDGGGKRSGSSGKSRNGSAGKSRGNAAAFSSSDVSPGTTPTRRPPSGKRKLRSATEQQEEDKSEGGGGVNSAAALVARQKDLDEQQKSLAEHAESLQKQRQQLERDTAFLNEQRRFFLEESKARRVSFSDSQILPPFPSRRDSSSSSSWSRPNYKQTQTEASLSGDDSGKMSEDERTQRREQLQKLQVATERADNKLKELSEKEKLMAERERHLEQQQKQMRHDQQQSLDEKELEQQRKTKQLVADEEAATVKQQQQQQQQQQRQRGLCLPAWVQTDLTGADLLLVLQSGGDRSNQESASLSANESPYQRSMTVRPSSARLFSALQQQQLSPESFVSRGSSPVDRALLMTQERFNPTFIRGDDDGDALIPHQHHQDFSCQVAELDYQQQQYSASARRRVRSAAINASIASGSGSVGYVPHVQHYLLSGSNTSEQQQQQGFGDSGLVDNSTGSRARQQLPTHWAAIAPKEVQLEVRGETMTVMQQAETLGSLSSLLMPPPSPFGCATPTLTLPRGAGVAAAASSLHYQHQQQQQQNVRNRYYLHPGMLSPLEIVVPAGGPSPSVVLDHHRYDDDDDEKEGNQEQQHGAAVRSSTATSGWAGIQLIATALHNRRHNNDNNNNNKEGEASATTATLQDLFDVARSVQEDFKAENAAAQQKQKRSLSPTRSLSPAAVTPPPPPQLQALRLVRSPLRRPPPTSVVAESSSSFEIVTPELQQQQAHKKWVAHSGAACTAPILQASSPQQQQQQQHRLRCGGAVSGDSASMFWTEMEDKKRQGKREVILTRGQLVNQKLVVMQQQQQQEHETSDLKDVQRVQKLVIVQSWDVSSPASATPAAAVAAAASVEQQQSFYKLRAVSPVRLRQMGHHHQQQPHSSSGSPSRRSPTKQQRQQQQQQLQDSVGADEQEHTQSIAASATQRESSGRKRHALPPMPEQQQAPRRGKESKEEEVEDEPTKRSSVVVSNASNSGSVASSVKNLLRRRSVALAREESAGFTTAHDNVDGRETLRMVAIAAATKALSRKDLQCLATVEKAARDQKVANFLSAFGGVGVELFRPQRLSTVGNAVFENAKGKKK